jgi:hypothetical protein
MRTRVCLGAVLAVTLAAPPAAAVAANGLTISPPSSAAFSVTVDGTDQTGVASLAIPVSYTSNALNKFATSGWSITATSTVFSGANTARTLATTATAISITDDPGCTDRTCNDPGNSINYPLALPAGSVAPAPVTIVNAAPGSGMGSNIETLQLSVAIPANTYADTYKSTLTLAVVEGP